MKLIELIQSISKRKEIIDNPPVLLDLGASDKLNPIWEKIGYFSIAITFDADNREFGYIEKETSVFKKLFVYNCIVSDRNDEDQIQFYLTKSPYCSSTLKPLIKEISSYHYSDLFEVNKVVSLKAKNISLALQEMGITKIDWFKTDTQGTDLRLFRSLPISIQDRCIITEFEPGFIDVYENEDKISHVLSYMENSSMRIYDFKIFGPLNISKNQFKELFGNGFRAKMATINTKSIPGWAEISYINKFQAKEFEIREYLLGWLFMTLQEHHSIAFHIITNAKLRYTDDLLLEKLCNHSKAKLRRGIYTIKTFRSLISILKEKIIS